MTTAVLRFPLQSPPVIGDTVPMASGPGRVLCKLQRPPGSRPAAHLVVSSHPPCPACRVGRMTWDPDGRGGWRCGRCQHAPDEDNLPREGRVRAYVGHRDDDGGALVVRPDGSPLELAPSLALRRHSPDGFEWGYHGSGPAQLALALLLDHAGDAALALRLYQRFKADQVATWRGAWALDPFEVEAWLRAAATAAPA